MALTYSRYLELETLLSLQHPQSEGPEHDETLFIIVHQVYELWFKELLHEFDYLAARLDADETAAASHTLKRILTILKVLVAQLDVLETMTPLDFLSFRDRLDTASGLQSVQFRELECVLGFRGADALARYPEGSTERERLATRLARPPLWTTFLRYLARGGHPVLPDDPAPATPTVSPANQHALVAIYRHEPTTLELCERLVDLDEGLQEWRYRHVKMVQRTIGTRAGTGSSRVGAGTGSSGVDYLMTTLFQPAFPDLWAIRTEL